MRNNIQGVSPVVGTVLLVAIIFISGSTILGFILTIDFSPTPDATVEIQQEGECSELVMCNVTVTVSQMSNSDYVLVGSTDGSGNFPTYVNGSNPNLNYKSLTPEESDDVPDTSAGSSTYDSNSSATLLVGAGDSAKISDLDVGEELIVFAGNEKNEVVITRYNVLEIDD